VALADWTAGVAAIAEAAMERAVVLLDAAAAGFRRLGKPQLAAATQVSKLIALGMLGQYDQATAVGLQARDALLAAGDTVAAGRVEQNLGTIALRRDRYAEAEQLHRAAGARFEAAGALELLVAAENALAADLFHQLRLREADTHYRRALDLAQGAGLELRRAEVECNLGELLAAEGRYDQALALLDGARRRYHALGLRHEAAYAEQTLADAYLQLNMAAEAAAIYARVTPTFAELGLRAEQALALAHRGQAALLLGRDDEAMAQFAQARQLFAAEGNRVKVAMVTLFEAQGDYRRGAFAAAAARAHAAEQVFVQAGSSAHALAARWLRGEAARALGRLAEARALLEATLREAEQRRLAQLAQRCHVALGLIALAGDDRPAAEAALRRSVAMIEELRATLPSEEFRSSFIADKLASYSALIRLCLDDPRPRVHEALDLTERARSRALAELLGRAVLSLAPDDAHTAALAEELAARRAELNVLYRQQATAFDGAIDGAQLARLQAATEERERAVLDLTRQLQLRGGELPGAVEPCDWPALQRALGPHTAVAAYYMLDGELLAFVVTDGDVRVFRRLADEAGVEELIGRLRFQIDAMRRGARSSVAFHEQLTRRARHYAALLYQRLVAPLEAALGDRRLVVLPHRALHYVPFHALHDGERYLIERREVSSAPSGAVLLRCLQRPRLPLRRALMVGVPDARAPFVRDEILALAPHFPERTTLLGDAATAAALRQHAPEAELLHLACHGLFRPDSPLFSALQLADGRFTTRDAYALRLRCNLVVLSACETGRGSLAPGDELIGLARGFLAAGAPTLLVSMWPVDDAGTLQLMGQFYGALCGGASPAAALREAQLALLRRQPHPFFWAPFVVMGRW
jgi:CHAT domain-containing protein/tetratricopeptide (TPR) repeat protein